MDKLSKMTSDGNFLNIIKRYTEEILDVDDLNIKSRKRHIVDARKIFCKLARLNTTCSFEQIGKVINKDHATVIYNVTKADIHIEQDSLFRAKYHKVLSELPVRKTFPKKPTTVIEMVDKFERITIKYEQQQLELQIARRHLKSIKGKSIKSTHTKNEIRYRELSEENRYRYDFRVDSILNMMEIVERKEEDKYEQINTQ
jgi:hypothetical protein